MPNTHTVTSPILIIGPGRSGTTWLVKMLGQHPDVQALPEHGLVSSVYGEVFNSWWSRPFLQVNCRSDTGVQEQCALNAVRAVMCGMFPSDRSHWVMKIIWGATPIWGLPLSFLKHAFPEARYLHMVRSPVTNLPSMLEYLGDRPLFKTLESAERIYIDAHREGLAIRDSGVPYLKVHQEQIRSAPEKIWEELVTFCGLRPLELPASTLNEEILSSSSTRGQVKAGRQGIPWSKLSGETFELCQKLGYETPSDVKPKKVTPQKSLPQEDELLRQVGRLSTEKAYLESVNNALQSRLNEALATIRELEEKRHLAEPGNKS
jgi:hypothetical protein